MGKKFNFPWTFLSDVSMWQLQRTKVILYIGDCTIGPPDHICHMMILIR